jgi:hypothetical protein
MTKLLSSIGSIISVIITAACSNSSPVSNFKAPPKFEPVDRPIMVESQGGIRIGAIRLSSTNEASIELLTDSRIDQFVFVNTTVGPTDSAAEDDSEDDSNGQDIIESELPEYLVFTEMGKPFDIFVYDYTHGIRTAVFDLQSEELLRSDERVCDLDAITRIDPETLDDPLIYSYDKFGIYFSAARDCSSDWKNRNFYELVLFEDEEGGTLIELPPNETEQGNEKNIVTVPDISAQRQSAREAVSDGGIIVTSPPLASDVLEYGILGYSFQEEELQFYLPIEPDSTTLELLWSIPLPAKRTTDGAALFPNFILASNNPEEPIIIQYTNDLYRINKDVIFDLGLQTELVASLSLPYATVNDLSTLLELSYLTEEDTSYFRDGNFIKSVDSQAITSIEKNVIDELGIDDFSFTKEESGFTIYKHLDSNKKAVTFVSLFNIESTLEPAGDIPYFASNARLYENVKKDAQGNYTRTVQPFINGSKGIAVVNSTFTTAIDLRNLYPGNVPLQTALLEGDITSKNPDQLIKDGALYVYDSLGLDGERTFLGRINANIREIIAIQIQTETYGTLIAQTEDNIGTFFFNPKQARSDSNYFMQRL